MTGTYTSAAGVLTRPHIQPADLIKLTGVDLWGVMIAKAESAEREEPLGIRVPLRGRGRSQAAGREVFDVVVCSFGLSDIDDLDGTLAEPTPAAG